LILFTVVGGALAAGGANAINCYIDRDIDEIMPRTRRRPLPQHRIAPRSALLFGTGLGVLSFALLWDRERAMDILYWWVFSYPTGGSAYDRFPEDWRLEFLMGYYPILDRAPKGRDEDDLGGMWIRRHDEYELDAT